MIKNRNEYKKLCHLAEFFSDWNLPDGNKGKISKKQAEAKAELEYDEFNKTQQIESDFDKEVITTKINKKSDISSCRSF